METKRKYMKMLPKKLQALYTRINVYLKNPRFQFATPTKKTIVNRLFDYYTLGEILVACDWFVKNYTDNYKCKVLHSQDGVILYVIDQKGNIFVEYTVDDGKVCFLSWTQNYFINILKESGIYDEKIHCVIDVPICKRFQHN